MTVPMIGNWRVKVLAVRPFTIHGDLYYELEVIRDDLASNDAALIRVPQHAVEIAPAAGQVLVLSFLMGQVVSAKRQDRAGKADPNTP